MKKILVIFLASVLMFVSGCSTVSLTPNGSMVRHASEVGPSCEFIGTVASSYWDGMDRENIIKNNAAEMGANWVVNYKEAYKCPESRGSAKRVDKSIYIETKSDSENQNKISKKASSPTEKLQTLQKMLDDKLINQKDFDTKKKKILDEM